ncbi:MAG: serine/arginine repetitive matrix protein 2 [Acidimicrobiales bacterium]
MVATTRARDAEPRDASVADATSRVDKVAAAHATLLEAVAAIQSGDDWRNYLGLQARLHAYSPNSALLIATQHATAFSERRVSTPLPTYVAGFSTWKALGRVVEKGQQGYVILAPLRRTVHVGVSPSGAPRVLTRDDATAPGEHVETRSFLRGFRAEHVFASEQTTGADLPTPPTPRLLEGEAPAGVREFVTALISSRGFAVRTVESAAVIGGANGLTAFEERTVVVRGDMDGAAQVKTLLHEAAHVLLHDPAAGVRLSREVREVEVEVEVEVEAVAFVVAADHGMATNDYSFPYVASWAGDGGLEVVRESTSRVASAAREIISCSPADHYPGGRVPGVDLAIAAARSARELCATTPDVTGGLVESLEATSSAVEW